MKKTWTVILIVVVIIAIVAITNSRKDTDEGEEIKTMTPVTSVSKDTVLPVVVPNTVTSSNKAPVFTVLGGNFYFKPNSIKVKEGDKVTINFKNDGGMHNFVIDEFNVKSKTTQTGTEQITFIASKKGTFEYYCSIGEHRQMGMKGNLIVE